MINFLAHIWKRTAPEVKDYSSIPPGKFISEWVELEDDQECFNKAIEYLQLWKYFMLIKCKDQYELYDEQLVFKPVWEIDFMKKPPTLAVKLYLKEK